MRRLVGAALALAARGASAAAFEEMFDDGGADNPAFWDKTYKRQGEHGRRSYEWYGLGFEHLQESLSTRLPKDHAVLVVGSGDSNLSADMAAQGWQVTSVDFSEEVTSYMRARHPGLDFVTQDARKMTYEDGRFGSVLDKGLSDCIGTPAKRRAYFGELHRVVRTPGGTLIVIAQRPLSVPRDLGPGWLCEPRRELYGPLFVEDSPNRPPRPEPGTDGQVAYYFLACQSRVADMAAEEEDEADDADDESAEGDLDEGE